MFLLPASDPNLNASLDIITDDILMKVRHPNNVLNFTPPAQGKDTKVK